MCVHSMSLKPREIDPFTIAPISFGLTAFRCSFVSCVAMGKGDQALVPNDQLAGTWEGNGCCLTPECIRIEISPACAGGICVMKYCGGCPIPYTCQYMMPCCGKCYTDCDNEGYWTPDANTIDGKCGYGFKRKGAASAPGQQQMQYGNSN